MTLRDLHNIPKFAELFVDPRFIALLHYQREHITSLRLDGNYPETLIWKGGYKDGWLDCLNNLQEHVNPPKPEGVRTDAPLYRQRP